MMQMKNNAHLYSVRRLMITCTVLILVVLVDIFVAVFLLLFLSAAK